MSIIDDRISYLLAKKEGIFDRPWFALNFGPYIAMNKSLYEGTHRTLSLRSVFFRFMVAGADLLEAISVKNSFSDIRKRILEINRIYTSDFTQPLDLRNAFTRYCDTAIANLTECRKQRIVTESAMIDFAPIVQNQNMLSQSPPTDSGLYARFFGEIAKDGNYLKTCINILRNELLSILHQNQLVWTGDSRHDGFLNSKTLVRIDNPLLRVENPNDTQDAMVKSYYFFAACMMLNTPNTDCEKILSTIAKAIDGFASESSFMESVNALSRFCEIPDFFESYNWKETETTDRATVQELAKKTTAEISNERYKVAGIQAIVSYLGLHQNLYCNQYTNIVFLRRMKHLIYAYSYYSDSVLIARIRNYMICPVMDLLGTADKIKYLVASGTDVQLVDSLDSFK